MDIRLSLPLPAILILSTGLFSTGYGSINHEYARRRRGAPVCADEEALMLYWLANMFERKGFDPNGRVVWFTRVLAGHWYLFTHHPRWR